VSSNTLRAVTRKITQAQLRAYADAARDHNPIHIDPEFARRTPFGGTIAHGMLVLAMIGEMMYAAHGEGWLRQGKLKVRFKAPARPGDTVTASGEPAGSAYAVQCSNERGEVLVDGRASVGEDA
jgi:3-hydroxybutyryl-CoA dehydratase